MDHYVVIGNPVSHSKSPFIHRCFADQTGQSMEYRTMLVERGNFAHDARAFFADGGKGANVTVPFKEEAFSLVKRLTPEAATAGAVNTLYLDNEQNICGHNTDGLGLVRDVCTNQAGSLTGKRILILGAGGSTRGMLHPFIEQQPAGICIANRTVEKAETLARDFNQVARENQVSVLTGCGFDALAGEQFDWIFNATSASLHGDLPPLPAGLVTSQTWCYDLMYAKEPTLFCTWAMEQGAARIMDGLGMLVEQAAESFQLWRGVRPETGPVLAKLSEA